MSLTKQAEGYTQIISYVLVLVAAVEGAAWAAFGVSFWSKAVFIAWAVAMVWTRPWLVNTRILALAHGDDKLAASAAAWLRVSLAITAFSLFSLYSEAMDAYKARRIAESAPVLAQQAKVEQADSLLRQARESANFDDAGLAAAVADHSRLQAELQAARSRAQAQLAAQQKQVEQELAAFWETRHANGFRYAEILDNQCTPLKTRYGLMKSAASELCQKLQAIQRKLPDENSDPEIARILAELDRLAPALGQHKRLEAAKLGHSQAQEGLQQTLAEGSGGNPGEVFPPVFHRISNLTGNNVTADHLVSLFGLLGILLLLYSLNLFQEGRLLCLKDADGHIRPEAATRARSWLDTLAFWKASTGSATGASAPSTSSGTATSSGAGPVAELVEAPAPEPARAYHQTTIGFTSAGSKLPEQDARPSRKREPGTGDTDTRPPHNRRYLEIRDLILNRKIAPTIYALTQYDGWGGKRLGKDIAKTFLEAMAGQGELHPFQNDKGQTQYWLL